MAKTRSEKSVAAFPHRKNSKGFTLIEILIALIIVATLTAIAYPAYKSYIDKAMVTTGISTLETVRKAIEEFHFNNYNYPTALDIATGEDGSGKIVLGPALLAEFKKNLSFESYVPAVNNYTLTVHAKDRLHSPLVLTPGGVVTLGP